MTGMIVIFLFGWLIYAGLCRLVFGKPPEREYYILSRNMMSMLLSAGSLKNCRNRRQNK